MDVGTKIAEGAPGTDFGKEAALMRGGDGAIGSRAQGGGGVKRLQGIEDLAATVVFVELPIGAHSQRCRGQTYGGRRDGGGDFGIGAHGQPLHELGGGVGVGRDEHSIVFAVFLRQRSRCLAVELHEARTTGAVGLDRKGSGNVERFQPKAFTFAGSKRPRGIGGKAVELLRKAVDTTVVEFGVDFVFIKRTAVVHI